MADISKKLSPENKIVNTNAPGKNQTEAERRKKPDRRKFACLNGVDRRHGNDRRDDR
jgi:hypothetical protein